ncbi:hypothetical protein WJ438_28680 [Streptomyces sp. GD-15H]|uniref:hypothetical protein n=1 Tax=Streptomyces sp. GD-15H TaxID=3129112 RepID=UPI0032436710
MSVLRGGHGTAGQDLGAGTALQPRGHAVAQVVHEVGAPSSCGAVSGKTITVDRTPSSASSTGNLFLICLRR